jgi:hypothetical protein
MFWAIPALAHRVAIIILGRKDRRTAATRPFQRLNRLTSAIQPATLFQSQEYATTRACPSSLQKKIIGTGTANLRFIVLPPRL